MDSTSALLDLIDFLITTNNNKEVTAERTRTVLRAIVSSVYNKVTDPAVSLSFMFFTTATGQSTYSDLSMDLRAVQFVFYGQIRLEPDQYFLDGSDFIITDTSIDIVAGVSLLIILI